MVYICSHEQLIDQKKSVLKFYWRLLHIQKPGKWLKQEHFVQDVNTVP